MSTFIRAWWKPLLVLALVAAIAIGARMAWVNHGETQYAAGYAKRDTEQKQADAAAKKQREQEKMQNEQEAQRRIDLARNDAMLAAQRAGGLQQQLIAIREQLRQYSSANGFGQATGNTGILLADLLGKSVERNRQLAEYADRAAAAGATCERQYDSLTNRGTSYR